jgi:hypothetical protein
LRQSRSIVMRLTSARRGIAPPGSTAAISRQKEYPN